MQAPPSSSRERAGPSGREAVEQSFAAFVEAAAFPCLGAKAAQSRGQLDTLRARSLLDGTHDTAIVRRLQAVPDAGDEAIFRSLAVLFPATPPLGEAAFEAALWRRLAALHAIDRREHGWDPRVSDDPASPEFSMSFGGKAFYVVGMHPRAGRPGRRTETPVMVFNLHHQFEILRADGRFAHIQRTISDRDLKYNGSTNPMLATALAPPFVLRSTP